MKLELDELVKQDVINLSYKYSLSNDDLDVLCPAIEKSTVLKKLSLTHNNLTLADGKLAAAIAKNKSIKVLSLDTNSINSEGAKHLAAALKKNNTLQSLQLSRNNIGDEGAKYIAYMLTVNTTLQTINLSYNKIGDKGAQSIAAALNKNTSLHTIGLGHNNIGDDGAESIATSLVINTGIREIYLGNKKISDKGAKKLAEALESNHNIKHLNLNRYKGYNKINEEVMDRINKALTLNNKEKEVIRVITPSDNTNTSINNDGVINSSIGGESAIGMGKKPTPEQYEQMMATESAKQSSSDSSLTNSGSTSDQKMPAVFRATSDDLPNDGIVLRTPSQNTSASETTEAQGERKVEDALQYMDLVRREFGDHLHIYYEFLEIMQKSKAQEMDTIELIHRIRRLFHGHIDLILGFNAFLPDGYKIEMKEGYNPPRPGRESQPPKKRQRLSQSIMGGLNPQRLNFGALSSSQDSSTQPVDFDQAMNYVAIVKKRFATHPSIYNKFLDILNAYHKDQRGVKEVVDEVSLLFVDHADLLKGFVNYLPNQVQAQAKKQLEGAIKKAEEKKKVSRSVNDELSRQKDLTKDLIEDSSRQKKHENNELTKVKDQLNSALKEKEDAQKLVASMKADITRKGEEIEKKEQEINSGEAALKSIASMKADIKKKEKEIKSRDANIANKDQENERLKKELVDAQKKVVTIRQEKDTIVAQKDQQLKSALDRIAERDTDIAKKNKQLESIKRILNPAADDECEPATKRTRTEDTPTEPKVKSVQLDYEDTHCSICTSKFSIDMDSTDENIRKHLPVLSSSKTCDHYFCHGCILEQQAAIAEEKSTPKWIACMECRTMTSFCPSEPKYHRFLIRILKKAKWVEAPMVKEELVE